MKNIGLELSFFKLKQTWFICVLTMEVIFFELVFFFSVDWMYPVTYIHFC